MDSVDNTKVYYSADKGDNWAQIDIDPSDSSGDNESRDHIIQAGYHDLTNKIIYCVDCDNDGTADDFDVWKLDYSASESTPVVTEIDTSAGADVNSVYAYDIFLVANGDLIVIDRELLGAVANLISWKCNAAPFVLKDAFPAGVVAGTTSKYTSFSVNANFAVAGCGYHTGVEWRTCVIYYNGTVPILSGSTSILTGGYQLGAAKNRRGAAYDKGREIVYFIVNKIADGKYYLANWDHNEDELTCGEEADLAICLDRNTSGTVPNEQEKAFAYDGEIIYELKPRRNLFVQLQNINDLSDQSIIAMTDQFVINDDGDMFEFTNIETKIAQDILNYGILGVKCTYEAIIHPDHISYFSNDDSIKIYDNSDNLWFWGRIIKIVRDTRGIYHIHASAYLNEMITATYETDYSGDDTDTKQKDMIDNGCGFCYRSSSIVGTTTTYDYEYKRAIGYLFYLARFLERQVTYIEPDGKVWTKAYDGLTATGESWDIATEKDVHLIDIPGIGEKVRGYYVGKSGITRAEVRYKNNATVIRPTTYATAEQTSGIIPIKEFRDAKLEAEPEANQVGDNLYAIFSAETIYLGLFAAGQGFLQPGKTIQIQGTGQIAITQKHFLLLQYSCSPKNDIYYSMMLSNNIIFPREYISFNDTTITQINTANLQAFENQESISNIEAGALVHNELNGLNDGDVYEHISQAQKDLLHAIYTLEVHNNTKHNPNYADELIEIIAGSGLTGGGTLQANRTINCSITQYTDAMVDAIVLTHKNIAAAHHVAFVQADADALYSVLAHLHDDRYYTETEIDDRVFEKANIFPVAPTEGDLHYDTVDEALYRRSGDAQAWIQIGAAGAGNQGVLTLDQVRANGNRDIADDTLVFSNDTERIKSSVSYTKIKEITIYRAGDIRIYWEAKCAATATSSKTRVRINGVAQGAEHINNTDVYEAFTEDVTVAIGDLLQIYGYAFDIGGPIARNCFVRYQRIKFAEYVSTAGY